MPVSMYVGKACGAEAHKKSAIKNSLNRAGRLELHEINHESIFAAFSHTPNCALGADRLYVDEDVVALYGGIYIDDSKLPWTKIIEALKHEKYELFLEFNSQFMLIVHFKTDGKTFWVSDRFSQFPAYYTINNSELLISSSLATFFDCLEHKSFNQKWLTDYIVFNLPIDSTTPIEDVYRMPAASVCCFDGNALKTVSYGSPFTPNIQNQSDKETKEQAYELFKERFPKYYTTLTQGSKYACAITAGYDARLAALFAPTDIDLELYTYGMPVCDDIVYGRKIANAMGVKHNALGFTPEMIEGLPEMAELTSLYSGGSLNLLRSTLQWLYEKLSDLGFEAASGGIVGDHFFRSDGTPGGNLSVCATKLFVDPAYNIEENPYFPAVKDKHLAMDHYMASKDSLEKRFDWSKIKLGERHLHYAMYELSPKYYGAENELAEQYLNLTSPYWDCKVREFAYKSTVSSMTMNENLHGGVFPYWRSNSVFAYILLQHPVFRKIPVSGLSPHFLASGSEKYIKLGKVLQKSIPYLKRKLFSHQLDPQEDWPNWFGKNLLYPVTQKSAELCVRDYINETTLKQLVEKEACLSPAGEHTFIGGKILTAEYVLRKF